MRRPMLALALVLGGIAAAAQQATTASNAVPPSTAVHRSTIVTGATIVSLENTVLAGTITGVTVTLRGTTLVGGTVRGGFGSDEPVVCSAAGALLTLDLVSLLSEGSYTCTGFAEQADRPRQLVITAS